MLGWEILASTPCRGSLKELRRVDELPQHGRVPWQRREDGRLSMAQTSCCSVLPALLKVHDWKRSAVGAEYHAPVLSALWGSRSQMASIV